MQAVLDVPTTVQLTVSQEEAQGAARIYVAQQIDPTFVVVEGAQYHHKPLEREVWRFFVQCADGPVGILHVDAQSGKVIPLTDKEIRVIREKATILLARKQGVLPVNEQGYVVSEYARRAASRYLNDHLSMFYSGADPLFVPGDRAVWQVSVIFKLSERECFTLGVMDVEAQSGQPLPLSTQQLERIRERTRAIIGHPTPATTTAG
jgi:hypothetical protein